MGRINSKAKGSKGERDLCKWWKDWTGQEFTRVPSSGGLRWSRTSDTTGDIINADQKHYLRFPFSIECKVHKSIDFKDILKGNKNCQVIDFWGQASDDAKRGSKIPILFMRENGMAKGLYYVALPPSVFHLLRGTDMIKSFVNKEPYFLISSGSNIFYVITSKELLSYDYSKIYKLVRKLLKNSRK